MTIRVQALLASLVVEQCIIFTKGLQIPLTRGLGLPVDIHQIAIRIRKPYFHRERESVYCILT